MTKNIKKPTTTSFFPRSDLGKLGKNRGGRDVWAIMGRILFWVTWPGIWLVVRLTPPRTRVVVICDNKLLLVKDWLGNGQWNIPGGGLHRGEVEQIGAVRELREETGIAVDAAKLQDFGVIHARSAGIVSKLICFYVVLPELPAITLQRIEILNYCWVDLDDIQSIDASKITQIILATFMERNNLLH